MKSKITQNQHFGLRVDLPYGLTPGSQYIAIDTGEFFVYTSSGIGVLVTRPIVSNNTYLEDAFKINTKKRLLYSNKFNNGLDDFTFNGTPWTIDNTQGSLGFSAQSGGTGNNIDSRMYYTFDSPYDAIDISVDIKQWQTEYCCDHIDILVDGVKVYTAKNLTIEEFTTVDIFIVGKGEHVIEFYYRSDGNTTGTLNKVNIDNLTITEADSISTGLSMVLNSGIFFTSDLTLPETTFLEQIVVTGIKVVAKGGIYVGVPENQAEVYPNYTTGTSNVAMGDRALQELTSGSENVGIGIRALQGVTSGFSNTGIGRSAISALTTGSYNTAMGYNAGGGITTGIRNIILSSYNTGISANMANCSYNVLIGYNVNPSIPDPINSIAIGNSTTITKNNQVTLGNGNTTELRLMKAGAVLSLKSPNGAEFFISVTDAGTINIEEA